MACTAPANFPQHSHALASALGHVWIGIVKRTTRLGDIRADRPGTAEWANGYLTSARRDDLALGRCPSLEATSSIALAHMSCARPIRCAVPTLPCARAIGQLGRSRRPSTRRPSLSFSCSGAVCLTSHQSPTWRAKPVTSSQPAAASDSLASARALASGDGDWG